MQKSVTSIETANTIAMFMEAGKIKWGDIDAVLNLLQEMKDGTETGDLIGQGCGRLRMAGGEDILCSQL